jgi:heat shock protein HtpX
VPALRLDAAALVRQRRLNRVHSTLILLSLTGLAGVTGAVVGGPEGLLLTCWCCASPLPRRR